MCFPIQPRIQQNFNQNFPKQGTYEKARAGSVKKSTHLRLGSKKTFWWCHVCDPNRKAIGEVRVGARGFFWLLSFPCGALIRELTFPGLSYTERPVPISWGS